MGVPEGVPEDFLDSPKSFTDWLLKIFVDFHGYTPLFLPVWWTEPSTGQGGHTSTEKKTLVNAQKFGEVSQTQKNNTRADIMLCEK